MSNPVISNSYVGNGSTVLYSFTFPYIETTDLRVSLDAVETTSYILANATTIQLNTAPASGVAIKIFRVTADSDLKSVFFPGSAVRARDLNDNFTQSLFVVQEARAVSDTASTQSAAAEVSAATANTNATAAATSAATATTQATAAAASASTASAQATQASTDATAAQTSATAAAASSVTAASEAAQAATDSASAITTAQGAVTTANSAATDAASAISTANAATSAANAAATTANSATTTANGAVTTANSANTAATSATSTANTASTNATTALNTANAASAAVSNAVLFTLIANVAAIPGSPSNNDYVEMGNSTGVESFSPLSGVPSGFVGASGLTVRLRYDSSASSWVWMSYFANDSEDRYLTKNIPVVTGDATNGSGQITLNCENNSHGVKIKGPPHSAAATYTLTLPNNTGTNGQFLSTNGSGVLSWGTADVSSRLALAGGTMTGLLTLSGAPTANLHAATKQYVDSNAILVADGGNFDSGASLVTSSSTFDGGSF